jgi:hypothetical protein
MGKLNRKNPWDSLVVEKWNEEAQGTRSTSFTTTSS